VVYAGGQRSKKIKSTNSQVIGKTFLHRKKESWGRKRGITNIAIQVTQEEGERGGKKNERDLKVFGIDIKNLTSFS